MTIESKSASNPAPGNTRLTLKLLGWLAVGILAGTLMAWLPGLLLASGQSKASLLGAVADLIDGFTYSVPAAVIVITSAALFGRALYRRNRQSSKASGEHHANQ